MYKLRWLIVIVASSLLVSNCGVAADASLGWHEWGYQDEFTDQKFIMYRTDAVDKQFLSLKCGAAPYGKYYEPSIAFHSPSTRQAGRMYSLKIRVDDRKAISRNVMISPFTTNQFIEIKWGNEKGKSKEITDKLASDFKKGNKALIQIAGQPKFYVGLSGFTKAFNATNKICKDLAEKDNGSNFRKAWLPAN
jgi:hypothetical protein